MNDHHPPAESDAWVDILLVPSLDYVNVRATPDTNHLILRQITGPVVIGENVHLTRTVIGPNTAIGDGCRLVDAKVEESIVLDSAEIHGWRIRDSLIGRGASLRGSAPPGFVEVTLGERSEILGE